MNKRIKFPYYSGNIYKPEVLGYVSLENFIYMHENPSQRSLKLFSEIRKAETPEIKRNLKQKLFAFTPSVVIKPGESRVYDNIHRFTGLMQIDYDGLTFDNSNWLKYHLFRHWPSVVCSYLSPSGRGVKCLLRTKIPLDVEHFKAMHKALTKGVMWRDKFDVSTKNCILPLFLSADRDILYRDFSEAEPWDLEDWSVTKHETMKTEKPASYLQDAGNSRVLRILRRSINDIVDFGHPQVRTASLVLGSRVGAGYITESEARQEIESLIRQNPYLAKGVKNYINTANWGITEGIKNPKYY
jgi:hypothetical protein